MEEISFSIWSDICTNCYSWIRLHSVYHGGLEKPTMVEANGIIKVKTLVMKMIYHKLRISDDRYAVLEHSNAARSQEHHDLIQGTGRNYQTWLVQYSR